MPDVDLQTPRMLPDIGSLKYNGVIFSSLFKSHVSNRDVLDNATRTVKYVEWTITVEGYVTLGDDPFFNETIDETMTNLREQLDKAGGILLYNGRGMGAVQINAPGSDYRDVAWGPKPQTIDFVPLGQSKSALVTWTVTTCLPAIRPVVQPTLNTANPNLVIGDLVGGRGPLLQFNEEIDIDYHDDCYTTLSIRGTMEIPLTRVSVDNRTVTDTVDSYREKFMTRVANGIDLEHFRVTKRHFGISRDKRTMEWEFLAEELPPMGLPERATVARGTYSCRPMERGYALINWICSLKCTYTIRKGWRRREAWRAFLFLLNWKMKSANNGRLTKTILTKYDPLKPASRFFYDVGNSIVTFFGGPRNDFDIQPIWLKRYVTDRSKAFLVHFGFDEGLYLDSKTTSFEASWQLVCNFDDILLATGIWRYDNSVVGGNVWATSVKDIMGWRSWMTNTIDPSKDVIVDMGGTP